MEKITALCAFIRKANSARFDADWPRCTIIQLHKKSFQKGREIDLWETSVKAIINRGTIVHFYLHPIFYLPGGISSRELRKIKR